MSITHRRRLHPPSKLCACIRTDSARAPRSLVGTGTLFQDPFAFLLHAHSDGLPVQGARGAACGSGDIRGHTGTEHSDACPAPACSRSLLSSAHTHSAGDASCAGAALSRWAKRAGCTGPYVLRSCSRGKVPGKATGAMRGGRGASRSHGPGAPSSAPRYGMGNLSLGRLWAAVPVPVLRHVCPERASVREPLHAPLALVELREMLRPDVLEDVVWSVGAAPDSTRGVCVVHELCSVTITQMGIHVMSGGRDLDVAVGPDASDPWRRRQRHEDGARGRRHRGDWMCWEMRWGRWVPAAIAE
jgi:hypothetical protein